MRRLAPLVPILLALLMMTSPLFLGDAQAAQTLPSTETLTTGTLVSGTFPDSLELSDDDKRVFDEESVTLQNDTVNPDSETLNGSTCTNSFPSAITSDDDVFRECDEVSSTGTTDFFPDSQTINTGTQSSGTFPDDIDDSNDVRVIYDEEDLGAATTDLQVDTQNLVTGTQASGTFPDDVRTSNDVYVVYREADTGGGGSSTETQYAVDTTNTPLTDCTRNRDLSTTAGTADTSFAMSNGDTACFESAALTETRPTGVWSAFVDLDRSGGAPPNPTVDLAVQIIDASTGTLVETIASCTGLEVAAAVELECTATGVAEKTLDDDRIRLKVTATVGGARNPILQYNGAAGTAFDTRVLSPVSGGASNYELNVEHAWTETCTDTRRLRIEAFTTGENFLLQVDDGTDTGVFNTRITISATSDPNAYQTYDLTSGEWDAGEVLIRYIGDTESSDTTQDDLTIDHVQILCVEPSDWQLSLIYSWTGVDTTGDEHRLFVEARLGATNPENIEVYILGSDEVTRSAAVCTVSSTTETEYDCGTLTADQLDGGTPDIEFNDTARDPDTDPSSLEIDRVRIQRSETVYAMTIQYDWTGTINAADFLNLSLRGNRTGDTETVSVDVWDWEDADWNVGRLTITSSTEVLHETPLVADCTGSADDCERSPTDDVRIRYNTPEDTSQTTASTDELWIQVVDESFQMEVQYSWTGVESNETIELIVEANRTLDTETINVDVLTPPSTWTTRLTITSTTDTTQTYILTTEEYNSGSPSMRFKDTGDVGGAITRLAVDRLLMDSYTVEAPNPETPACATVNGKVECTLRQGPFQGITADRITGSEFVSADGLVLAYDMQTLNQAGEMVDFSGEGNHGTLTGTTDVAGQFGRARDFDGVDDQINSPDNPSLEELNGTDFTVIVHFTIPVGYNPREGRESILGNWGPAAPSIGQAWSLFFAGDPPKLEAGWRRDNSAENIFSRGTTPVDDGEPHTGAFRKSGLTFSVLLDGAVEATATATQDGSTRNQNNFNLAVHNNRFAEIEIDEVLALTRALSDAGIRYLSTHRNFTLRFNTTAPSPIEVSDDRTAITAESMTMQVAANNNTTAITVNITRWDGPNEVRWTSWANGSMENLTVRFSFILRTNEVYGLEVDNVHQMDLATNSAGALSFDWTLWSEHAFELAWVVPPGLTTNDIILLVAFVTFLFLTGLGLALKVGLVLFLGGMEGIILALWLIIITATAWIGLIILGPAVFGLIIGGLNAREDVRG